MKMNRQIILRVCCGACLVVLLAGCAMLPKNKIAKSATNYNLVVERAENEMLLLNIVRSSKRHPMYFTGFSLLRGNVSYEISTGEISIPFGKIGSGLNGAYTAVSPVLKYSSNPSFDVSVLNNKEFYNAMMTTVPLETIYYFLQQGWPRELLLHLFIQRIDYKEKGKMKSVNNDPEHKDDFEKFQDKLKEIFLDCNIVAEEKTTLIGGKITVKDAATLKDLVEVSKAGLKLEQAKGENVGYKLSSSRIEYKLIYKDNNMEKMKVSVEEHGGCLSLKAKDEVVYILHLRSPEAILYYLGEIVRAEMQNTGYIFKIKRYPDRCKGEPEVPLFVVHKKTYKDISPHVAVTYEGTKYVIPRSPDDESNDGCKIDRSMHVLSLVSLLIGMQKAYVPAPATGVVTTTGR